jgi:TfoX/Sxy family transcriptional regulator of competence genes
MEWADSQPVIYQKAFARFTRVFRLAAGLVLSGGLLLFVAGCKRAPADLHRAALQAAAQAQQAFEQHDAERAARAAARAEEALEKLKAQANAGKLTGPDAKTLIEETRTAAVSARNYAQLAWEEQECRKRLAGLKLRVYQGARDTVCGYALRSLAPAAEQALGADTNSLSAVQRQLAWLAWNVAVLAGERVPLSNGAPDWAGAAADLRAWGTNPPPKLGLFLAGTFALNGFTDLALSEIESADLSRLSATNTRCWYHLERGALYALNGWDRTAARELDQAMQLSPNGWNGLGTTQAVAVFHFWLADHAIQRKHFLQADHEIALAAKAWPGNPLTPFLDGERLTVVCDWAKAAEALEAQAAASKDEWLARHLSQRAHEIREREGNVTPLFSDPAFIVQVVLHAAGESAQDSIALKRVQDFIESAKGFGQRLIDKLPVGGQ